ncbi:YitT family protein [Terribacillus saccharophilus]|uniref:YitT family protein n=1 Tax=Terribacillus saccharophilus TaxID=361277 RepID=UPI001B80B638|nr:MULTISPECIES: YitT family protein [Terribacillus]MCM3226688.1 YitT family protein [Terribacillus saccharophilus]MEC0281059.1 YitT family protein [Terribacillus saccharophilus]MEC0289259.1 YitT family protein [Terribacillus saccharophilus]
MKQIKQHFLKDLVFLMAGSFLFALAVNIFAIPSELGEGGVTGVTIILFYALGWAPSIMNLILNGLLIIIGYRFLDKQTVFYTIIVVILNSFFLHLTESWEIASDQILVNAVFGGLFAGVGIGLVLKVGGTTAGTAILARLANKYLDWNTSFALLFFDLIVVAASWFIIGTEKLLITVIMLYIATKVMEFVIEGLNPKKAVFIISNQKDTIAKTISTKLDRGVTLLEGRGYYTQNQKEILYVVISKQELLPLKKIVRSIDTKAFITLYDVRDVFGEGFMDITK